VRGFVNGERKKKNEESNENRGEVDLSRQAASVLELLGLLKGKGADGADQAYKHQEQAGNRNRRGPQRHDAGTDEKCANDNVKRAGRNRHHAAPRLEQCKLDAG
jgi:hypothetical protein